MTTPGSRPRRRGRRLADPSGKRRLTVGTAGHVDHGKTSLVAALSGAEEERLDRLAEERSRGISIALGYAELTLPDSRRLSVVDVPGHERLVRTMVSGATGMDLFLLAVAADDGVMPQTREHVRVLQALGIHAGVVAITKADLVPEADVDRVEAAVRAELPGVRSVRTSTVAGTGLDELRARLTEVADGLDATAAEDGTETPPVLHIDRVFSLPGAGTVVTGTLRTGTVEAGQRLEVIPSGLTARVRSIEVHDQRVQAAGPRRRVAVALSGVKRAEVRRGEVLAAPGSGLAASYRLDVSLDPAGLAADLSGARIQVHAGTRDAPARLVDLGVGLAQLRLEAPLIAAEGDRVVLRSISPPDTLGGATVLDPAPRRHGTGAEIERLLALRDGRPPPPAAEPSPVPEPEKPVVLDRATLVVLALLDSYGDAPPSSALLAERLGVGRERVDAALAKLVAAGRVTRVAKDVHYEAERVAALRERLIALAGEDGTLTVAQVRDELGSSRKYAQALLEHLDAVGATIRHGDAHVLRRPSH